MAPAARCSPPLLLLVLAAATVTATATNTTAEHPSESDPDPAPSPTPTPWPERFHAVLFTNLTNYSDASTGPPLRMTDLYYDWPRRRNLNLVRHQLSPDPLYDVEWNNGTTFYFDSSACRVERFPVGVLPPWWLSGGGAEYLGRRLAGGIDCHLWAKAGFIFYYEEARTGRPVRWDFVDVTGIQQYVMSFEPGVELEDAQWQAPAYCFPDDDDDDGEGEDEEEEEEEEEEGKGNDNVASTIQEGDELVAASRLLRKLAVPEATSSLFAETVADLYG